MDLSIDYEQTRTLGNNVLERGNQFADVLAKITSENDNLKNSWTGADAQKYANAVAAEIENMKVLNNAINEIGEFLINAANSYQRVNESNQDGIR